MKLTAKQFTEMMATRPFERVKAANMLSYKGFELIATSLYE
jgi:hypothetical protein